ncbi:hypothetical protein ACJX0J_032316, partial [Zea mays]
VNMIDAVRGPLFGAVTFKSIRDELEPLRYYAFLVLGLFCIITINMIHMFTAMMKTDVTGGYWGGRKQALGGAH